MTQVKGKRGKAPNTRTTGTAIWCWSRLPHASEVEKIMEQPLNKN